MNETIDSTLPIDKYLKRISDGIRYNNANKTPYTEAQVIQKSHHAVFFLEYMSMPESDGEPTPQMNKRGLGSGRFCG